MAYLELTAGQVDANSPLDATLFGQIRDNDIYMKAEKLERDGTIPMTGNLAMGTNSITGATNIDGTGDLTMGTITMVAGSGTGLDMQGKDIVCEDLQVNGVLSGPNLLTTSTQVALKGTNETAAANGELRDTSHVVDFTTHLDTIDHFVFIPNVSNTLCYFIQTVTDADNFDFGESTTSGKSTVSSGNGNIYWIVKRNETTDWVLVKEYSWAAADVTDRDLVISPTLGGFQRTFVLLDYNMANPGAGNFTITYGDETDTIVADNGEDGWCMLVVLAGTNTLTLGKTGGTGSATCDVYLSHVHPLAGSIS
jgi:hypothetical protein